MIDNQGAFFLDVQARLQGVEDLLMSMGMEDFVARTANGSFEWRSGVTERPPKRRKAAPGRCRSVR